MNKQTAMQEFIEWVDTIITVLPDESLGAKSQMIIAKLKAESMLEKEKEQIKEAHLNGQSEWDIKALEDINKKLSEEYYKETYE